MAAEMQLAEESTAQVAAPRPPPAPPKTTPRSLAERIRADPPPPGVKRFYNKAFKMPERPRRGDS